MKVDRNNMAVRACFYLYYIYACTGCITWEDIRTQNFTHDMDIEHPYYQAFSPEAYTTAHEKLNKLFNYNLI